MNESTGELSPCIKPQNQSENINELAGALAKAQSSINSPIKNQVNPFFKSKYADLNSIIDCSKKSLSSNGLAVTQLTLYIDNKFLLVTKLIHSSGQWMQSQYPLPANGKPQEIGSALTYARRYALSAILNVSADDDDDGNAASNNKPKTQALPPRPKQVSKPAPIKPPTRPPANLNNQKAKTYAPGPEMAPPPDMPPHKLDLGQYVMTKGANAGKTLNSIDKLKLDEWLKYMTEKGFTKGADYKQVELYLNQTAATATSY